MTNSAPEIGISARLAVVALTCIALALRASAHSPIEGHEHTHTINAPHPAAPDPGRFFTSRHGLELPLPAEKDAFFFAVFGDRTGGYAEGLEVLAQAVDDVNVLEPDLVLTVGDMVQGYNQRKKWLGQMREFKGIMKGLLMPWFPVPGNHDIYWRGGEVPPGEHESDFETHFGPLWYAFEHKNCWFIVLFSDEGNPATGEKNFEKPSCQKMSPAQFSWLAQTLEKASDTQHIFLFLHHPRWLKGNYGDDWDRVHDLLVDAGNVSAVFGGHIHRMRYDGPRDGIEYVTLATTGGVQSEAVPKAGFLHQYHLVTVREQQIAIGAVPVGEVMDVRGLTGEVSTDAAYLSILHPEFSEMLPLHSDGSADYELRAMTSNTVHRPIEVTLLPESRDSRWSFWPDHSHAVIEPGESYEFVFRASRMAGSLDDAFRPAELALRTDYLADHSRISIPETRTDIPLAIDLPAPPEPDEEMVLVLNGKGDCLKVASNLIDVPDGPLTLECWFNAESFADRTGLIAKTENSEYGFFVNEGIPSFHILLGNAYAVADSDEAILKTNQWHHLAGVYDGSEVRLYLDGRLVESTPASGARRMNSMPLIVGGDVNGKGAPVSFFHGRIDGVHLSKVARYEGARFEPRRRQEPDPHSVLLLNMDQIIAQWVYDESPSAAHPMVVGSPRIEAVD